MRKKCTDCFSVFILPPSFEVLKNRLTGRGTESPEVIEKRLEQAKAEMAKAKDYDYVVVNDDLDTAVEELCGIILAERLRTDRNRDVLDKVCIK